MTLDELIEAATALKVAGVSGDADVVYWQDEYLNWDDVSCIRRVNDDDNSGPKKLCAWKPDPSWIIIDTN